MLLLQWDNPSEAGNIPGKLFEYIGVGRPILAMGYEQGEMARVVEESGAELVSRDPNAIASILQQWITTKRENAHVPAAPDCNRSGLTTREQAEKLTHFIARLLPQSP